MADNETSSVSKSTVRIVLIPGDATEDLRQHLRGYLTSFVEQHLGGQAADAVEKMTSAETARFIAKVFSKDSDISFAVYDEEPA